MTCPNASGDRAIVGRFIVQIGGERHSGLSAHDVAALLASRPGIEPTIYRLHRIDEAGRSEMIGVTPARFTSDDCLMFLRNEPDAARADYREIRSAADRMPPPCRIELEFAEVPPFAPPHVVAMVFVAACDEAVGAWLNRTGLRPGDRADGGRVTLQAYRDARPRVIDTCILDVGSV